MDQFGEAQGKINGDLATEGVTEKGDIFELEFGDEVFDKVGVLGDSRVAGESLGGAEGGKVEGDAGDAFRKTV